MSLTEILAEIPKLSFAERRELVRRVRIADDETDPTFQSRVALHEQARVHRCRSGRGDSHNPVGRGGTRAAGLPKRFSLQQRVEWQSLCDETSPPGFCRGSCGNCCRNGCTPTTFERV